MCINHPHNLQIYCYYNQEEMSEVSRQRIIVSIKNPKSCVFYLFIYFYFDVVEGSIMHQYGMFINHFKGK